MNERLLSALDLSAGESKIYRAALKARRATPALLGRMAGIKRTTAYHIARALAERGFLKEDSAKRPRVFSPAAADDIHALIENERDAFGAKEKTLRELAGELSRAGAGEAYPVPEIRFVEEEKLERFLYRGLSRWHASMMAQDSTWWGFQDHSFVEQYSKITDWYWKRRREEFFVKLLSNQSDIERRWAGKYSRRAIKFWNKAGNFLSTTWIAGDYIIMVNTRQRPFYLVEIHNTTIAHDLREVFRNLWALV